MRKKIWHLSNYDMNQLLKKLNNKIFVPGYLLWITHPIRYLIEYIIQKRLGYFFFIRFYWRFFHFDALNLKDTLFEIERISKSLNSLLFCVVSRSLSRTDLQKVFFPQSFCLFFTYIGIIPSTSYIFFLKVTDTILYKFLKG